MRMAFPWRTGLHLSVYAKTGVLLTIFYLNYFLIVPRLLGNHGSWWRFIAINLVLVAGCALLMYWIDSIAWNNSERPRRHEPDHWQLMMASASRILRDAATMALTISLAVVIKLSDKWIELDRRQRALRETARESELQSLRSQLDPHFLFNSLNTIYSLIAIDPDEAGKAVLDLSGMLRYVTYHNPEKVAVDNEINFIENYVGLMKLRMGDRPVELKVEKLANCEIPPLLLVGIVENAFKHGNTPDTSLPIKIDIKVDKRFIVCRTFNHIAPKSLADTGAGGVGLPNLRRRLALLYGEKADLELTIDHSLNICNVCMKIPSK